MRSGKPETPPRSQELKDPLWTNLRRFISFLGLLFKTSPRQLAHRSQGLLASTACPLLLRIGPSPSPRRIVAPGFAAQSVSHLPSRDPLGRTDQSCRLMSATTLPSGCSSSIWPCPVSPTAASRLRASPSFADVRESASRCARRTSRTAIPSG